MLRWYRTYEIEKNASDIHALSYIGMPGLIKILFTVFTYTVCSFEMYKIQRMCKS